MKDRPIVEVDKPNKTSKSLREILRWMVYFELIM